MPLKVTPGSWRDAIQKHKDKGKARAEVSLSSARQEALSGFRPDQKGGSKLEESTPKSKEGKKTKKDQPTPIRGIYIVDYAGDYLKKTTSNSGEVKVAIKDCPAPNVLHKARLENSKLARIHSPNDALTLDPSLDHVQTASWLAKAWFPDVYTASCAVLGWKDESNINPNWFIPLLKHYYTLNSVGQQTGATAYQLISRASTEANQRDTRDIYIALPFPITSEMREAWEVEEPEECLRSVRKGKAKATTKTKTVIKVEPPSPSKDHSESDQIAIPEPVKVGIKRRREVVDSSEESDSGTHPPEKVHKSFHSEKHNRYGKHFEAQGLPRPSGSSVRRATDSKLLSGPGMSGPSTRSVSEQRVAGTSSNHNASDSGNTLVDRSSSPSSTKSDLSRSSTPLASTSRGSSPSVTSTVVDESDHDLLTGLEGPTSSFVLDEGEEISVSSDDESDSLPQSQVSRPVRTTRATPVTDSDLYLGMDPPSDGHNPFSGGYSLF
ncbi:hypothetical protein FRC08_009841 [Ceratobasidium sp. 394]|nr:hypothetical protein FRC08_009841 [Ceratobasidium sp. 394]KAG9082033.1 hypothetical protein FS749_007168 [Ceratobasidium sp. UAMH 11750]